MLKLTLAAVLLASAPIAAASGPAAEPPVATPVAAPSSWTLANGTEGCMVHAASGRGTVLSITAMPGEDSLLFVIQNHALAGLEDGQPYPIAVEFDDLGEWEIEALAQANLDSDGPGLIFAVRPGRPDGANFLKEFAAASGMHVGRAGTKLDSVSLTGGNTAMSALGQCLGQKYSGAPAHQGQGGPLEEVEEGEKSDAIPI